MSPTIKRDPGEPAKPPGPQRDAAGLAQLWARHDGAEVIVDLSEVPDDEGFVYVAAAGGAERFAVEAAQLTLLRVTRPLA